MHIMLHALSLLVVVQLFIINPPELLIRDAGTGVHAF